MNRSQRSRTIAGVFFFLGWVIATWTWAETPHNLILFVPDGLRSQIVESVRAPALARLREEGVDFRNSHSLFPTFTTANASAFATGHKLGDTGDFSNLVFTGVRVLAANATVVPFLESDPVLREVNG
jgi:predicted AlkP superfamily pyrophosphatase or phosphodiesterase